MLRRKTIFLTIAALIATVLAVPSYAQTTDIAWSPPVPVAAASFGASSPKIARLQNGQLVAIWGKSGANPQIYFSRKVNDSFEAPVALNTGSLTPDIYSFGGLDLAVFGNKVFVIFENYDSGVYLLRSEDGGATFLPPTSVFDPPAGDWTTLASLAVDGAGNPIVSVIRELVSETNARYIVVRSEDGGASFLPPVVASEPADGEYVCECCPSSMVVSGDSIWLVFRNNFDNLRDAWVTRSDDAGASFSVGTDMDATNWMVNACPVSGPRLLKVGNDSLLAVWMSGASGQGRIYGATLHGGTMDKGWQFDFPASNASGLQSFPSIAGNGDTLCVVWEETGFGGNSGELVYRFSQASAAGLAAYPPTNLTQTPGNQKYPSLIYADGRFHLLYQSANALEYRSGPLAIIDAVEEAAVAKPFALLANPASRFVSVKMGAAGSARFSLVGTTGQLVQQWPSHNVLAGETLQLDLSGSTPSGLYFLKLEKDGNTWATELVLQSGQ